MYNDGTAPNSDIWSCTCKIKITAKLTYLQYMVQYYLILVELVANFARDGGSDKELPSLQKLRFRFGTLGLEVTLDPLLLPCR